MLRRIVFNSLALVVGLSLLSNCAGRRLENVYNVENFAVATATGSGKPLTVQQVKLAIRKAALSQETVELLGATQAAFVQEWQRVPSGPWILTQKGSGHLVATLNVRGHEAQVDIKYSPKRYSIIYKDSKRFRYSNGQIHMAYNRWIKDFQKNIQKYMLDY